MKEKPNDRYNSLIYSAPRDKLPKDFTGKDIIQKMQQNWYKDLVGSQRESAFQEAAKHIVQ
jgi:hypothetical protein